MEVRARQKESQTDSGIKRNENKKSRRTNAIRKENEGNSIFNAISEKSLNKNDEILQISNDNRMEEMSK